MSTGRNLSLSSRASRRRRSHGRNATVARRLLVEQLETRFLLASLSGNVFQDVDGSGTQDGSETGAAGIVIELVAADGTLIQTTNSDSAGDYSFENLSDGTYSVRLALSDGSLQTTPGPVTGPDRLGKVLDELVSPQPGVGDSWPATPLGIELVGSDLYVANRGDSNSNTDNIVFRYDGASWVQAFVAPVTDLWDLAFHEGHFWLADRGSNSIVKVDSTGAIQASYSGPANARLGGITWVGNDLWIADVELDEIQRVSLDDTLETVTVEERIDAPGGNLVGLDADEGNFWTTELDTDRVYSIDMSTGETNIVFAAPSRGRTTTTGIATDGTSLWTLQYHDQLVIQVDLGRVASREVSVAGVDVSGIDFGVTNYGEVSGVVFEDTDEDGIRDAEEGGLAGWRIYVDQNDNDTFEVYEANALTDATGAYSIGEVIPGTRVVRELVREPGWQPTVGGAESFATITSDGVATLNFGNLLTGFGPVGPETLVNTTIEGGQGEIIPGQSRSFLPRVSTASDGSVSVVVWDGPGVGDDAGVFAQFYDASGVALGSETRVNTTLGGVQHFTTAAASRTAGTFVIGWTDEQADSRTGMLRLFDASRNSLTAEIPITSRNRDTYVQQVAMNASGQFVVLFGELEQSQFGGFPDRDWMVQRFDATGVAEGRPILVSAPNLLNGDASIAIADDGSFVVTWDEAANGGNYIYVDRFGSNGKSAGPTIQVNDDPSAGTQWKSRVSMDGSGNFVVTYREGGADAIGLMKYYQADGSTTNVATSFGANANQFPAAMITDDDGIVHLAWQSQALNADANVESQRFAPVNGVMQPVDIAAFIVNSTIAGDQNEPAIAVDANGNSLVAWRGLGVGDDDGGIFLQRYESGTTAPPQTPAISISDGSARENEGAASLVVSLSQIQPNDVVVTFTVGGSATQGEDFDITSTEVTIDAGTSSVEIPINIIDDSARESNETVEITLVSVTGAGDIEILDNFGVLTIQDNDKGKPKNLLANEATGNLNASIGASQLNTSLAHAWNYWEREVGLLDTPALNVQILDLPGQTLAWMDQGVLSLDRFGNGYGWQSRGNPFGYDLSHTLIHELGHWLGYEHDQVGDSLMSPSLALSTTSDADASFPSPTSELLALDLVISGRLNQSLDTFSRSHVEKDAMMLQRSRRTVGDAFLTSVDSKAQRRLLELLGRWEATEEDGRDEVFAEADWLEAAERVVDQPL